MEKNIKKKQQQKLFENFLTEMFWHWKGNKERNLYLKC